MTLLKYWRAILITLLIVWSVILIHPFSAEGVEISNVRDPASAVFREGDILIELNNNPISSIDNFDNAIDKIDPNDTVRVTVKRETFPYNYGEFTNLYVATEDENENADIAITVRPVSFSKIEFGNGLIGGNQLTIETDNPKHTKEILKERFKITKINDYSFSESDGDIILRTTYGKEIFPIIENKGAIEARIGEKVFFTNSDVESYCLSGVDCLLNLYPKMNTSENQTSVAWKFGFEAKITEERSDSFADLTKDLSIANCEFDTCILNDSIKYYLDGKFIGEQEIYAEDKGKKFSRPFIGGYATTKEEASDSLYFAQAALAGEIDAEITDFKSVGPTMNENFRLYAVGAIVLIALLGAGISALQIKSLRIFLGGILASFGEVILIFGALSGLNFVVKPVTLFTILALPIITAGYQIYLSKKIKKESFILKKIAEQDKKINTIFIGLMIVSALSIIWIPEIGSVFLLYTIIVLLMSKGIFISRLKEKR